KEGYLSQTRKSLVSCFKLTHSYKVIPCICSELLLSPTQPYSLPILFVFNDSWFSYYYMRNLMLLATQLKAVSCQQDIIGIGHFNGYWINKKNGQRSILKS